MNEKIVLKNLTDIKPKHKHDHDGYDYNKYEVTERADFDQAYICFYEIMPKSSSFPKHYHSYNTECFYIIKGEGIVETDEENINVKTGDIIVFPRGKKGTHKLTNTSTTNTLLYIDFDTTNSPDIIHYVDSNKIGIIEHNISSTFYREDDNVEYFEGEK